MPVPESLFHKVAGLRTATLLKQRFWHRCFQVNFLKFLRVPFQQNTSGGCLCINIFPAKAPIVCKKREYIHNLKEMVSKFQLTLLSSVLILHKRQVNFKLSLLRIKLNLCGCNCIQSSQTPTPEGSKFRNLKDVLLLRQCQNFDVVIISFVILSLSSQSLISCLCYV